MRPATENDGPFLANLSVTYSVTYSAMVGRVVGMESERTFRKQADQLLAGSPLQ